MHNLSLLTQFNPRIKKSNGDDGHLIKYYKKNIEIAKIEEPTNDEITFNLLGVKIK